MTTYALDYSYRHPNPADIKRAGYVGAIRYFSHDPAKDLTLDEVKELHANGLWVSIVWETTAQRAVEGKAAGIADRKEAEYRAAKIGAPKGIVLWYAVDADVDPSSVKPYFAGVLDERTYNTGAYGSRRVVESFGRGVYRWQTEAWSGGIVSKVAHLYQQAGKSQFAGSDRDVILKPFPVWQATAPAQPTTQPTTTAPANNPDNDLVSAFRKWARDKGLTV